MIKSKDTSFQVDVSEEPVATVSDTAHATVREPEISHGSLDSKTSEPTLVVDLGATGAQPKQDVLSRVGYIQS